MVLLDVSIKRHAKVVTISLKGVRQKRYLHFLCCSVVIDKKSWFQLLLVLLLFKEGQVKWAVFPTLISFVVTGMARCVLSPFVELHCAFSRAVKTLVRFNHPRRFSENKS